MYTDEEEQIRGVAKNYLNEQELNKLNDLLMCF